MDLRPALKSQYHAALKTLRLAIEQCPEALWNDPTDGRATISRVAYHTLFFTHFYLAKDQNSFTPWSRHQQEAQFIGNLPWEDGRTPKPTTPYSRTDLLDYCRELDALIDSAVDATDFSRTECGFPWYPMGKLEHQLVNLRHLQHHAAALATRLRLKAGIQVEWIGMAKN